MQVVITFKLPDTCRCTFILLNLRFRVKLTAQHVVPAKQLTYLSLKLCGIQISHI